MPRDVMKVISLDVISIRPRSKRPRKKLTSEQIFKQDKQAFIYKHKRGDIDLSKQADKRRWYWAIKKGIINKEGEIL